MFIQCSAHTIRALTYNLSFDHQIDQRKHTALGYKYKYTHIIGIMQRNQGGLIQNCLCKYAHGYDNSYGCYTSVVKYVHAICMCSRYNTQTSIITQTVCSLCGNGDLCVISRRILACTRIHKNNCALYLIRNICFACPNTEQMGCWLIICKWYHVMQSCVPLEN